MTLREVGKDVGQLATVDADDDSRLYLEVYWGWPTWRPIFARLSTEQERRFRDDPGNATAELALAFRRTEVEFGDGVLSRTEWDALGPPPG